MLESRIDLFLVLRQREPGLDAVEDRPARALVGGGALGVADALAGGHQIDRAGLDPLHRPDAVAMLERALEQVGDGGEVDVGVRADVHALVDAKPRRAHLIEEDERADHRPLLVRQGAVDLEPAEVVADRREAHQDGAVVVHSPGALVSMASAWT